MATAPSVPLSMVYGGGGVYGIAYGAGVAHGLAAAGVPVADAPSLGTSAGSWVASIMALGLTYDDVAGAETPRVPTKQKGILADIARSLLGDARHPLVSVSTFRVRGGRPGRRILNGAHHDLADLVAASSAAPGLLPSHVVDGHTYVDGGVRSVTSITHAAAAHQVVAVVPLAGRVMGRAGVALEHLARREAAAWRRRHPGSRATVIAPPLEVARLAGTRTTHLFDAERARQVYPIAYEQGARVGERLLSRSPALTR